MLKILNFMQYVTLSDIVRLNHIEDYNIFIIELICVPHSKPPNLFITLSKCAALQMHFNKQKHFLFPESELLISLFSQEEIQKKSLDCICGTIFIVLSTRT